MIHKTQTPALRYLLLALGVLWIGLSATTAFGQNILGSDKLAPPAVAVPTAILPLPVASPAQPAAPLANPAGAVSAGRTIDYRRVYVQEDKLEKLFSGKQRYLPMPAREFEKKIRTLESIAVADQSQVRSGALLAAEYEASLTAGSELQGTLRWTLAAPGSAGPLVPIEPCRLAIDKPMWLPDPIQPTSQVPTPNVATKSGTTSIGATVASHNRPRPALLGIGSGGQLHLRVDRPGMLEAGWSLRPEQSSRGDLVYRLEVPPSSANKLTIVLPPNLEPSLSHGMIVSNTNAKGPNRRWRMHFTSFAPVELRLTASGLERERHPLTLLRHTLTYDLSQRGLQLSAELKLDVLGEPVRQLSLLIDKPLELAVARYGDRELPWRETSSSVNSGAQKRVVIDLPEPLRGANRLLQLGAVAPLELEKEFAIPVIRVENTLWQEGTVALLVKEPLTIKKLTAEQARQTKTKPLPAPLSGREFTWQAYESDPKLQAVISQQTAPIEVRSGTVIDFHGTQTTGRYVANLSIPRGEIFTLSGAVSDDWIIDSVESYPAGIVADWAREERDHKPGDLVIHLSEVLKRERPVQLMVSGRRMRAPLNDTLRVNDLQLLDFRNSTSTKRLTLARAFGPFRLTLLGDENLTRLDPATLSADDKTLLGESRQGLLFAIDNAANELEVSLSPEAARFTAEVQVQATVRDESLVEAYSIRCIPEPAPLEKLLVYVAQSRAEPLNWKIAGSTDFVSARRLSEAELAAANMHPAGEAWELRFRPRAEPFTIETSRTSLRTPTSTVALASLSGSVQQRGKLVVRSSTGVLPRLNNHRLKAAAVAPVSPDQYSSTLAEYQFNPEDALQGGNDGSIAISNDDTQGVKNLAWAWLARLSSRYHSNGSGDHSATYWIENSGRQKVTFVIPSALSVRAAYLDGVLTDSNSRGEAVGTATISLPSGKRFAVVRLELVEKASPYHLWTQRAAVLPKPDVPVLVCRWNIWTPSGYDVASWSQPTDRQQPSWAQRFFGPLGRDAYSRPLDPTSGGDLQRAVQQFGGNTPADSVAASLWVNLQQRASEVSSSASDTLPGTVGDWVTQSWTEAKQSDTPIELLIDWPALAEAGLNPHVPLPLEVPTQAKPLLDSELLAQLKLLVGPKKIVLTTQAASAGGLSAWNSDNYTTIAALNPAVTEQIAQDGHMVGSNRRYLPLGIWSSAPVPVLTAWQRCLDPNRVGAELWGVTTLDLPNAEQPTTSITLVSSSAVQAVAWAVLLLGAALVYWRGKMSTVATFVLWSSVTLLALLSPASLVPITSGLWLGLLLGTVAGAIVTRLVPFPSTAVASNERSHGSTTTLLKAISSAGAILVLLWLTLSSAHIGHADDTIADSARNSAADVAADPTAEVLIPCDAKGHPVGHDYYVPESLYQELYRRTASAREAAIGWMITGSTIMTGSLNSGGRDTDNAPWRMTLDIETLIPSARVQIPFGGDDVQLETDGVRLDGGNAQFIRDPNDSTLTCDIPEVGKHRLEISFVPLPYTLNGKRAYSFPTVAIPTSRIESRSDPRAAVLLPSALGSVSYDSKTQTLVGRLGSSPRLVLQSSGTPATTQQTQVEAQQMLWLKVKPGNVVLDARWRLRCTAGQVERLRLTLDSRLRILPPAGDSIIKQIHTVTDDASQIEVELTHPVSDELTLDLSFLLVGSSGVGNLRLPGLELADYPPRERLLGVSISPQLNAQEGSTEGANSISITQFATAWGSATAKPNMALHLAGRGTNWTIAIQPRLPRLSLVQRTAMVFGRERATLHVLATVTSSGGPNFQCRFALPPGFVPTRVSQRLQSVLDDTTWAVDKNNILTVFLNTPDDSEQSIVLSGTIPYAKGPVQKIPPVRLLDAAEQRAEVLALEYPDIRVRVTDTGNLTTESAAAATQAWQELQQAPWLSITNPSRLRVVQAMSGIDLSNPLTIALTANKPQLQGAQLVALEYVGGQWQAAVSCQIQISQGVIDRLRFEVPKTWTGPFKTNPAADVELRDIPGESRRQLIVRLPKLVDDRLQLEIRGPLTLSSGSRPRLPNIHLLGIQDLQHFAALPQMAEGQQYAWDTQGLVPAKLPAGMTSLLAAESKTFQQTEHGQAVLRSVDESHGQLQVCQSDTVAFWPGGGDYFATTTLVIDPAGARSCVLNVPAGISLVHVRLNGAVAQIAPAGTNQFSVVLGAHRLPQRLQVLYRGKTSASQQPDSLSSITLVGHESQQTLWTLLSPAQVTFATPADSNWPVMLERLEGLAKCLQTAVDGASNSASDELTAWYRPWQNELTVGRLSAAEHLGKEATTKQQQGALERLKSLADKQAELTQQISSPDEPGDSATAPRVVADMPTELLSSLMPGIQRRMQSVPASASLSLPVETSHPVLEAFGVGLLSLLVALAVGLVAVAVATPTTDIVTRWPMLLVILLGLFWWLLLTPSGLGLAIMLLGTLGSLAASQFGEHVAVERTSRALDSSSAQLDA